MTVVLSPSQGEKPLTPAGDRFGRKPAAVRFVPRISYALDFSPREASWARSAAEKGGLKFGGPHLLPCAPCPRDGGGDRGLRGGGWLQSLDHGGGTGLEARPWHATSHNSSGAALTAVASGGPGYQEECLMEASEGLYPTAEEPHVSAVAALDRTCCLWPIRDGTVEC